MSAFKQYEAAGWSLCVIASGEKVPVGAGWNRRHQLPEDYQNGGLLHALSGTCSLDIDDLALTRDSLGAELLMRLLDAPDAVQITSGTPGRAKLLYRMPLGMPMPTKKVIVGGKTAFELRCASADGKSMPDVIPPSVHPSGRRYEWVGDWRNLPEVPPELMQVWLSLLAKDAKRNIPAGEGRTPASMDEVRSALFAIDPNCDRKTWVECGMALEVLGEQTGDPAACFELFDTWSAGSATKYNAKVTRQQWRSFSPRPSGIGIGTLFHYAQQSGWKRPIPDVSELFKPVKPVSRKEVEEAVSPAAWVPEQNLQLWPELLARRATEVAAEVGCDVTVPLLAGLSAVSAAVDMQTALHVSESWRVPPVMWLMTVGDPADKKTPGSKPMFAPLHKLEREAQPAFEAAMLSWLGKEARYAAEAKAYREWASSPDAQLPNAVPPNVTPLPPQPEPLRLLISDTTSQKLVHLSQFRPQGFLMWLDEMANWLKRLTDSRGTDDRGCWIQGYETGRYTMDRVGAGTIHTDNLAMSIYGNCQPEVFRQYGGQAASDGLLQRFMPVLLNSKKNALWQNSLPSFMSSSGEYEQLIRRTHALPKMDYTMSAPAMERFRDFCQWCMDFRELEKSLTNKGAYQTALGKMEGQCARLILLFHIIERPHEITVEEETVERAMRLMHKFFMPMMRYVYLEIAGQRDSTGVAVFNAVLQAASVRPTITLGELRRASGMDATPKMHEANERLRVYMDELAAFGFVMLHRDSKNAVWSINPALADMFADDRKRMIERRQAVIEKMRGEIEAKGKTPRIGDAVGYRALQK